MRVSESPCARSIQRVSGRATYTSKSIRGGSESIFIPLEVLEILGSYHVRLCAALSSTLRCIYYRGLLTGSCGKFFLGELRYLLNKSTHGAGGRKEYGFVLGECRSEFLQQRLRIGKPIRLHAGSGYALHDLLSSYLSSFPVFRRAINDYLGGS